ncbi:MAG: hypothetical protein RL223_3526 [Pseudomonadota bacterium]
MGSGLRPGDKRTGRDDTVIHLLNLMAAIALLVWGTYQVRTGMLRVFGENLRHVLARSVGHRLTALLAGLGVTSLVQSATATGLIVSSFVGRGLVPTAAALTVMLGADVGSALMAVVFSFDLSWLSPLLIVVGVVLFIGQGNAIGGRIGRVLIGLGLITLALQLIVGATRPLTASPTMRLLLAGLPQDLLLDIVIGAVLTLAAYSSLAIVLLTATLAVEGIVNPATAFGLVLGANIGSGLLALIVTSRDSPATRRLPLGNLLFKAGGVAAMLPLPAALPQLLPHLPGALHEQVVGFHLAFNAVLAVVCLGLTAPMAREALHQADVVEQMLRGVMGVLQDNDLVLAEQLKRRDDEVDRLYSAIKFYLTQISREALSERESRRWTDIVSFTINMEQIGDGIERVLIDIEDKKIRKQRRFSEAGMAEICHLHERLLSNLRLGMSVFLDGHVRDARRLLEEKAHFRDLEHRYAANHIARLQEHTAESIETSSLHLDLLSELKRINSHICSIAYPILESKGALAATRIKPSQLGELAERAEPLQH